MRGAIPIITSCFLTLGFPPCGTLAADGPAIQHAEWSYSPAWTLSSDDVLFGHIGGICQLDDGAIVLADVQLRRIIVIGRDGGVISEVAVAGDAPGELSAFAGACCRGDGEVLLVQLFPGRIESIDLHGTPLASLRRADDHADGALGFGAVKVSSGVLGAVLTEFAQQSRNTIDNTLVLAALNGDLTVRGEVHAARFPTTMRQGVMDETEGYFPLQSWAFADSVTAVVAPHRDAMQLHVVDLRTGATTVASRDLAPRPRTAHEVERIEGRYAHIVNGVKQKVEFILFPTSELVQDMVAIGQRTVLMVTSHVAHTAPPGTIRLDLFDAGSLGFTEVAASIAYRPDRDRLFVLPSKDIVVVEDVDDIAGDVPRLRYWRLEESRHVPPRGLHLAYIDDGSPASRELVRILDAFRGLYGHRGLGVTVVDDRRQLVDVGMPPDDVLALVDPDDGEVLLSLRPDRLDPYRVLRQIEQVFEGAPRTFTEHAQAVIDHDGAALDLDRLAGPPDARRSILYVPPGCSECVVVKYAARIEAVLAADAACPVIAHDDRLAHTLDSLGWCGQLHVVQPTDASLLFSLRQRATYMPLIIEASGADGRVVRAINTVEVAP